MVAAAVSADGLALQHAANLRADRGLALQAVAQNEAAMVYVAADLRRDRSFVLEAAVL